MELYPDERYLFGYGSVGRRAGTGQLLGAGRDIQLSRDERRNAFIRVVILLEPQNPGTLEPWNFGTLEP